MVKKCAIVCGSPSTEFDAPYDNNEFEIWVLGNRLDRHINRRVTRVFEIHDHLEEHPPEYPLWLANHELPLVVGEKFPIDGKHIEKFPYAEAKELFGADYLTSSPAYMMAYALLNGYTEIHIYGVDLAIDNHEYFWQRPCLEAWIGFAKGAGVKVYIPEKCSLGKSSYQEGKHWNGGGNDNAPYTEDEFLNLAKEHDQKILALQQEIKDNETRIAAHSGASQVYSRLAKVARAIEAKVDIKTLSETVEIK